MLHHEWFQNRCAIEAHDCSRTRVPLAGEVLVCHIPFLVPARGSRFPYPTSSVLDYSDNLRRRHMLHHIFFAGMHRTAAALSQANSPVNPTTPIPVPEYIHPVETMAHYKPWFPDRTSFLHKTNHLSASECITVNRLPFYCFFSLNLFSTLNAIASRYFPVFLRTVSLDGRAAFAAQRDAAALIERSDRAFAVMQFSSADRE